MIEVVQIPAWRQYTWLRHGFSTRSGGVSTVYGDSMGGGSLNLGWTKEDTPALVAENRRILLEAVTGSPGHTPITLRQVHGTEIHTLHTLSFASADSDGGAILAGDGLSTDVPGAFLGMQTADCVPVMLLDPVHRAVAVLHAGWRGTAAAMAEEGIACMVRAFCSDPETLLAAIGPSIGPCCYTVGAEVQGAFASRYPYASELFREGDGRYLDLWEANRRQLRAAGIPQAGIAVVGECTGCTRTSSGHRKYFSHRVEQGVTGRMMTVIGIHPV
jgi:YfiH family protein